MPLYFEVSDKIPDNFLGDSFGLDVLMLYLVFRNTQKQLATKKVKLTSGFIGGYFFGKIRMRETNGYATYFLLLAEAGT